MGHAEHSFGDFFKTATGVAPFPFQSEFKDKLQSIVNVPTGLGKTAMAILGWLWRRFGAGDEVRRQTPRRLVYCLPMRVLVEQTRNNAIQWLMELRKTAQLKHDVPVHALMGGEDEDDWDIHPEREAIIIGTQDMLLSRALNRGYAASRSRWPIQFGLLHTDCLWVFDEIQLMGGGLATTAQLEAFRRRLPTIESPQAMNGHGCHSVWMSATMRPNWLKTVDFKDRVDGLAQLSLIAEDHKDEQVKQRWNALKPLKKAESAIGYAAGLAKEIVDAHRPGTRTIVVVNSVRRACALFDALMNPANAGKTRGTSRKKTAPQESAGASSDDQPEYVLLHSRFRPTDRAKAVEAALAEPSGKGTIVVSTQVIEAGVDVSATTLFTELAPWASIVQRFGRCNRCGEQNEHACVRWIDLPAKDAEAEKLRFPYELADLRAAADQLAELTDVGLGSLAAHRKELSEEVQAALFPHNHTHVIRRRDLIDLFDTTPDLAGNDIDIDRFVREIDDSDVRVFWRAWDRPKGHEAPPVNEPAPCRKELCPSPVAAFREFTKQHRGQVWRWNFLDESWEKADAAKIVPGQVYLVHADAGGYSAKTGWTPANGGPVTPMAIPTSEQKTLDGADADALSRVGVWQTIAQHTNEVCKELESILAVLEPAETEMLRLSARWHDWGKAHEVFRAALPDGVPDGEMAWAKAEGQWKRYKRRHFRHEFASALAVLVAPNELIPIAQRDLIAYLIAAHHGKVRLSIRSMPNELRPRDENGNPASQKRFARGVWDGDELPEIDLGQANDGTRIIAPKVALSLEPMELGLCNQPPFAGQPSWAERMLRLRDKLGPFRLAYLEAILRAADMRASKAAERHAPSNPQAMTVANAREADHG